MAWTDSPPSVEELQKITSPVAPTQAQGGWDSAPPTAKEMQQVHSDRGLLSRVGGGIEAALVGAQEGTFPGTSEMTGAITGAARTAGQWAANKLVGMPIGARTEEMPSTDLLSNVEQDIAGQKEAKAKLYQENPTPYTVGMAAPMGVAAADLAETVLGKVPKISERLGEAANSLYRRAMKFIPAKSSKWTSDTLREANQVAGRIGPEVASPLSTLSDMAENANSIKEAAGKQIGDTIEALDQVGIKTIHPLGIVKEIRAAKVPLANNETIANIAEDHPGVANILSDAENILKRKVTRSPSGQAVPGGFTMSFKDAQYVKSFLRDKVNTTKPNSWENSAARSAYDAVSEAMDTAVTNAAPNISNPELMSAWQKAKQGYGDAIKAEKAVKEALRGKARRNVIGLKDAGLILEEMATNRPTRGAMLSVGKRAAQTFAPQTAAWATRGAANFLRGGTPAMTGLEAPAGMNLLQRSVHPEEGE